MPRQRRVEFPGAIYHVMARGDRRENIVLDDGDRCRFEATLAEVVKASGWHLYAWVLMSNHYHFLFQTPEPNLVKGMSWFQNTWTRRFNSKHQLWGHLFGGRYKAILVEESDYLTHLIHYIHLNPVRANLVLKEDGLESYPWCSLTDYIKPERKRRPWVAASRGMDCLELPDTVAGRRRFLRSTEDCVDWKEPHRAGVTEADGQSLQSTLRRGWYFGTEEFRENLLKLMGENPEAMSERRRKGYGGAQTRDHGISEAERIIEEANRILKIDDDAWLTMRKGDWRKGLVAGIIRERALVDNGWLARRLHMGARNTVSRSISMSKEQSARDSSAQRLAKKINAAINRL